MLSNSNAIIKTTLTLFLVSGFIVTNSVSAATSIASKITAYKTVSGVSGNLSSVGSDTLANLMTLWAEKFKRHYPNVNIQIQAAGSSTAPPALTESTANLGPMSRKMKSREIAAFEKRYGYKPTAIAVAIDALAIYVNKDNPVIGISIPQIDAIFSATRKCGFKNNIKLWGDLGLNGLWQKKSIQIFGRNSVSGTYGYFKKKALCKGDFKSNVNEQPGSASVVQSVTASVNSIGYSGIGYKTSGVKAIPIAKKSGQNYIEANAENAINGLYPLARFLYIYINKNPELPLAPLEREFITLIMSKQGQQVVVKDGYIALPYKIIQSQLSKLK